MTSNRPNMGASIDGVTIHQISFPLPKGMRSGIHQISTMYNIVAIIHAGGEQGIGYTFAFREFDVAAVREVATYLSGLLVGGNVDDLRVHRERMWAEVNFTGPDGIATMAASCLDMALWDVRARLRGTPLCRLLGSSPKPQAMYGSGGSLELSESELVEEALGYLNRGYAGYKFRVGSEDLESDVQRVHTVRKNVGPTVALAVDANQAWSRQTAARALPLLQDARLAWVEEPLIADDVVGLAQLCRLSIVPIAAGETVYGTRKLFDLVREGAVNILQPDLMRCGGVSGLLAIAALADTYRTPVAPHLYAEMNAHLLAGIPTGTLIEHLDGWFEHLFEEGPIKSGGSIRPGEAPGFGLVLDQNVVSTYGQVTVDV